MKKKLEACLFDLDGVIVDTANFHYLSWKQLANKLGFDFPIQENERLKGINRMTSLEIVLEYGKIKKTEAEKIELCTLKNDWYLKNIQDLNKTDIIPGVYPLLLELKNNDIKIGLGSASKNAKLVLEYLEITDMFETIMDGTNVKKSKPDPEVFIEGAKTLQVKPSNTVVFEDAAKGLQAAITGGFNTIGIGTDSSLQIADVLVPTFKQINLDMIKSRFSFE